MMMFTPTRTYDGFGRLHSRMDMPSFETYFANGRPKMRQWHKNGRLHREEGPAVVRFDRDGNEVISAYVLDGELLFGDGSAVIVHDVLMPDGVIRDLYHKLFWDAGV